MKERLIEPVTLDAAQFAPYGEVIEAGAAPAAAMNDASFERYRDLANVDVADGGGRVALSIARCRTAATFPHRIEMVERHPHGSQAFIPLSPFAFVVVVALPGDTPEPAALRAFVTNGRQGVNYRKGVWHMPMIALEPGHEFLIVDRQPASGNCDEFRLAEPLRLAAPAGA